MFATFRYNNLLEHLPKLCLITQIQPNFHELTPVSISKYNTDPRGVSLSKCHFHFRMCSATSIFAAATHGVPAAQSRFGHTKSPAGMVVQSSTRAFTTGWSACKCCTEQLSDWPRVPSSITVPAAGLQLCNEDLGLAAESCLQLLRAQVTTVAQYPPVSEPQNSVFAKTPG